MENKMKMKDLKFGYVVVTVMGKVRLVVKNNKDEVIFIEKYGEDDTYTFKAKERYDEDLNQKYEGEEIVAIYDRVYGYKGATEITTRGRFVIWEKDDK